MEFLSKFERLLKVNNLPRHAFAKMAGIPPSTINSLFDKGYNGIRLETVKKIAEFFGVSIDYLSDDNQDAPTYPDGALYGIIYRILFEQDITVADAARMCGVNEFIVRTILLQKQATVPSETMYKLAKGLNVPIERLLGEDTDNPFIIAERQKQEREYQRFRAAVAAMGYPSADHPSERQTGILKGIKKILDSEFMG